LFAISLAANIYFAYKGNQENRTSGQATGNVSTGPTAASAAPVNPNGNAQMKSANATVSGVPQYQGPQYQAPQNVTINGVPQYQAPQYQAPQNVSETSAHQQQASQYQAPQNVTDTGVPQYQAPQNVAPQNVALEHNGHSNELPV
jgi:hypothetical protein